METIRLTSTASQGIRAVPVCTLTAEQHCAAPNTYPYTQIKRNLAHLPFGKGSGLWAKLHSDEGRRIPLRDLISSTCYDPCTACPRLPQPFPGEHQLLIGYEHPRSGNFISTRRATHCSSVLCAPGWPQPCPI